MKRKIKKIFFEVISNTKILNIKFCSIIFPTTKILPYLQGTRQGGGLDNIEYGNTFFYYSLNFSKLIERVDVFFVGCHIDILLFCNFNWIFTTLMFKQTENFRKSK